MDRVSNFDWFDFLNDFAFFFKLDVNPFHNKGRSQTVHNKQNMVSTIGLQILFHKIIFSTNFFSRTKIS